jgi:hypothetical protein
MKKILTIITLLIITATVVLQATAESSYDKITINRKTYELKFSKCAEEQNMCINEYYLSDEKDWQWSELITVHYYGNVQDEKAYAQNLVNKTEYAQILDSNDYYTIFTSLHPYKGNDQKLYVEQDVFKAQKDEDSGIKVLQYATRYPYFNKEIAVKTDALMRKTQNDYMLLFKHFEIPEIVEDNFQLW